MGPHDAAALVAITVGFLQRRQATADSRSLRPATLAMGAGIIVLLGGIAGFAVDDNRGIDVAQCTEVFADGQATQRCWDEDGVTREDEDGECTFIFTMEAFCWEQDEAPLANDYGWGYSISLGTPAMTLPTADPFLRMKGCFAREGYGCPNGPDGTAGE